MDGVEPGTAAAVGTPQLQHLADPLRADIDADARDLLGAPARIDVRHAIPVTLVDVVAVGAVEVLDRVHRDRRMGETLGFFDRARLRCACGGPRRDPTRIGETEGLVRHAGDTGVVRRAFVVVGDHAGAEADGAKLPDPALPDERGLECFELPAGALTGLSDHAQRSGLRPRVVAPRR